jgi:hypothetical protein
VAVGKWLLLLSFSLIGVSLFFSFTNYAWLLTGRRSQSYPELAFLFMFLPLSILLVLDALILNRLDKAPHSLKIVKAVLMVSVILKLVLYLVEIVSIFSESENQTLFLNAPVSFPNLVWLSLLLSGFAAITSFKSR